MKRIMFLLTFIFMAAYLCVAQDSAQYWPQRVLLTNDDGIDDPKMIALAKAFSKVAETYVVAPTVDKSGTTHYASVFSTYKLGVERKNIGEGIEAYAVDGYPGDCVMLALKGIMKDNPPDLVISGINGGPNLGFDWLASGTIGAARIAAYWGIPAIAVSGMKEEIPGSLDVACKWIVQLAKSDLVHRLKPKQYLTVSIPRVAPSEIKGVKVAERAGIMLDFSFAPTDQADKKTVWQMLRPKPIVEIPPQSDAALYNAGYVVMVPMQADEDDDKFLLELMSKKESIPEWFTSGKKQNICVNLNTNMEMIYFLSADFSNPEILRIPGYEMDLIT